MPRARSLPALGGGLAQILRKTRLAAGAIGVVLAIVLVVSYFADASHFSQLASAEAAVAVAILTSFLLLANYDLVAATQRLAQASRDQTSVLLASVEPELRAKWRIVQGAGPIESEVQYVAGSLPARQVRVYGRRQGLLYVGTADTVTGTDGTRAVVMTQVAAAQNWPFVLQTQNLVANQDWIGVTWLGHGDAIHTVRWKVDPGNAYLAIVN